MSTTMTIKGVPAALYAQLKASAELNRRSLNSETIACLEQVLQPQRLAPQEHLARARAFRQSLGDRKFRLMDIDMAKREGRP